jgi:hypothetical protein
METKKEERSEYISIYVTPTLKREFEAAKDNQALKESIIKNFLKSETNWLESEIKEIDESVIKYSAKLIGIREAFQKNQSAYIVEIEAISKTASESFKKIDSISNQTEKSIQYSKDRLSELLKQLNSIDFYKAEKMLELVERISGMSEHELGLVKKLLS